jgi:hypothetical protein
MATESAQLPGWIILINGYDATFGEKLHLTKCSRLMKAG